MIKIKVKKPNFKKMRQLKFMVDNPEDLFVRVPGESQSGPCPYCSQFFFMVHDKSWSEVPQPIDGTHLNCVCVDVPLSVFQVATKATLEDTGVVPRGSNYRITDVRKGVTKKFDWLDRQSVTTKKKILGLKKAKLIKDSTVAELYDKRTARIKKLSELG